MTYCNLFAQMNFNIGAMIGNGLANLASQRFFEGNSFFNFGLPMFGVYQYPGINTYDMPSMYSNASLFTQQPTWGGYGIDNTVYSANFGSLSQSLSGGFNAGQLYSMDSFSYSTPSLYTSSVVSSSRTSTKTKTSVKKDSGSFEYANLSRSEALKKAQSDPNLEKLNGGAGWSVADTFQNDIPYSRKNINALLDKVYEQVGVKFKVTSALGTSSSPHVKGQSSASHYNEANPKLDIQPETNPQSKAANEALRSKLLATGLFSRVVVETKDGSSHLDVQFKDSAYETV